MKRNIYYFNSLLRIYNKYRRKLDNLRKANRNERRQGILQKHIERLYDKLSLLNASIKQKTVMAGIAMAAMAFVPQTADAQSQFAPKQINPFNLTGVDYNSTPTFADLDGDGDLDMLTADYEYSYSYCGPSCVNFYSENYFKYYQNIGTSVNPVFASPVVNPFGLLGNSNYNDEFTPTFVDLDGDGDKDIVYGLDNGQFYYIQNIGTSTAPNFSAAVLNPFGLVDIGDYSSPTFVDMDGDGDLDMISGEYYYGDFYYFQNIGTTTAPAFDAPIINPFGLSPLGNYSYSTPTFVDMDGDGDFDLLSGHENGDFYYFENNPVAGIPVFSSPPTTNPFNLTRVGSSSYGANYSKPIFVDLDNDGDMDLMAGDDNGDFNYYRRCAATTSTISPVSVCNYVSPSGIIKTTGGTFTDIIPNAAGCDSIITINLTINPVLNQTLTPASSLICGGSGQTNIILGSSQNGVSYYLRDNSNNAVVTGPIAGTGSSISIGTGTINATTAFNVFGEKIVNSQGLNFDNTNDFVDAGSGVDVSNSSFSVEFWAKKNSLSSGNDDHVIGIGDNTTNNNALHIGFRGGNDFTFAFFGNDLDASSSFTDLNWHHWAVTFDAVSKVRNIYRDGSLVAADVSSSNFLGTGNLRIGSAYLAGNNYFNGSLDEVRIWNTVRSASDINSNKNSCLSGSETGLLAYYKFEDAIGSATLSSATGNHNGTLQNMDVNNAWGIGASVCSTCNLQMSQVVTVTVSATPAPTISVNSGAICIGQSYTINPSGASTYTISGGNSVVSPTVNSTYTVTGTAADGCPANSPAIASLTVNALPVISVNSGSICSGQSFTINPSGASTYTISGGNTVVSPTVDASYNVTGTDANGCVSPVSAVSNVTVNALPVISANSGTICAGESFTINPSGASSYTISGGNTVVSPSVDATYNVTGADANGCVSSPVVSTVNVNALPTVVAVTNNTLLCVGETATLTASGATSYTWNTNANTAAISVSPTMATTYTVTGTDANGCANTTTVSQVTSLCTGINSIDNDVAASIFTYPNPTNGFVQITIPQELFGNTVLLTNTFGQVLETKIIDNTIIDYNLQNLATGIYFIQVKTSNGMISKKVIKN